MHAYNIRTYNKIILLVFALHVYSYINYNIVNTVHNIVLLYRKFKF
jgi:hypothetical protein